MRGARGSCGQQTRSRYGARCQLSHEASVREADLLVVKLGNTIAIPLAGERTDKGVERRASAHAAATCDY